MGPDPGEDTIRCTTVMAGERGINGDSGAHGDLTITLIRLAAA
jgi:hypothetical protein